MTQICDPMFCPSSGPHSFLFASFAASLKERFLHVSAKPWKQLCKTIWTPSGYAQLSRTGPQRHLETGHLALNPSVALHGWVTSWEPLTSPGALEISLDPAAPQTPP